MLIYLLDTNVISEVSKPQPNEYVSQSVSKHSRVCAISSVTWHEVDKKVVFPNLDLIENALNINIKLERYGTGIKEIAYVFVAVRPVNTIHGETLRYYKAKKEVFIQKKLPYELVEAYEAPQVLHLMAQTYLQSLRELVAKRKIEDFDGARLMADVPALFAEQGWLTPVQSAQATPA